MKLRMWPKASSNNSEMRVLWVTNFAAPYRIPVWDKLRMDHDLTVGLLESRKSLAADSKANRGSDWQAAKTSGIRFVEFPTWKLKAGEARFYVFRGILPLLAVGDQDVVVFGGWESPAYWLLLLAAIVFGVGRVGFYESTLATMKHQKGPAAWIRSFFFRQMHSIVVPGPAAREALQHIGVCRSKILEGFNAIDVESFHQRSSSAERSQGSLEGHHFLYVGQLISRKRVAEIIDAFGKISAPEDRLTIVGSGHLKEDLVSQAERQGKLIQFVPYVENELLPQLMSRHHTLVLASSEEVWGMVVNEALAAGLHVVVSENCGVVPSVSSMQGVLVANPDLADLAARLQESRDSWRGKISTPEILQWTPERFARVFSTAMRHASVANNH